MSWLYNVMRFRWIKLCTQQRSMNLCHKYSVSPFRSLRSAFYSFFPTHFTSSGTISKSSIFFSLLFSWCWSVSVCTQFAFVRNQFLMHKCRKVDLRHVLTSFLFLTHARTHTQPHKRIAVWCMRMAYQHCHWAIELKLWYSKKKCADNK